MAKKHDENKDLRSISRVARINYGGKIIYAAKTAIIGIHMWGNIDYLTHYCGSHFIWHNQAGTGGYIGSSDDSNKKTYRELKKASKAPKLTNKTKKRK